MPQSKGKITMKEETGVLVFENFKQQTIISREVGTDGKNLHRFIISPTYLFKFADNPSLMDYGDALYPLYANLPSSTINLTSNSGYPVAYLSPSNANDMRVLYIATSKGYVYALSLTGIARSFGQPTSLTSGQNETTLAKYVGKILFINPSKDRIYHIDETSTSTTWNSITGLASPKFGEVFSVYFYVADKSSASNSFRNLIKVYGTSLSQVGQLDLGSGLDIQDIVNNNNRFLVVIANPANVFTDQYMFLWDGIYTNRPFHIMKLPGIYVGSVNYAGAFFLFLKSGNSTYVYELVGYSLRMIDVLPQVDIPEIFNPSYRFTTYGNYIFFPFVNKEFDISLIGMYNIFEKETLSIYALSASKPIYGLRAVLDLDQNFRIFYNSNEEDKIYHRLILPDKGINEYEAEKGLDAFSNIVSNIYYSNWVNFFTSVQIERVEVFYGNKPPEGSYMDFILETKDERLGETTPQSVTLRIDNNLQDNYALFTNIGLRGQRLRMSIKLNTNGSYRGGIKRVVIYYSILLS